MVAALTSSFASTGQMSAATGFELMVGVYLGSALPPASSPLIYRFCRAPNLFGRLTVFARDAETGHVVGAQGWRRCGAGARFGLGCCRILDTTRKAQLALVGRTAGERTRPLAGDHRVWAQMVAVR